METALNDSVLELVTCAIEQTTFAGDFVITGATRLAEDLALGRFGLIKLALYLEEIFDIELSDEILSRFTTIADIVRHLSRNYEPGADGVFAALAD